MRQSKFTETQIVSILKEADAGRPVNELWRKHGISSATYYKWKATYGGLEASDVKRLKELEQENHRLKRMYADLSLENAALSPMRRWRDCHPPSIGPRSALKVLRRSPKPGQVGLSLKKQ